ncbi:branched-chain amino acid ABC transporter permease [Georgenia muralis]|uniref:Amino acid/amide ABC transporter membrane protein 2 (HAAT family) n=1 Tax=Georgenia muralis TaxID=154117 RepID=A0A3N4ZA05_9MICO|nr:branched-chain amino acid ABC transporter permease [Georgenia muralis]RPF28904.1 amino acid/amide ABC transporter membrane protein 2 (HAAT family) [Georgenia muralis]
MLSVSDRRQAGAGDGERPGRAGLASRVGLAGPAARGGRPARAGRDRRRDLLVIAVVVAVLSLWPFVAPNPYMLSAGVIVLNYAVFATGWNLMGGFTGYISLGHTAFFGLGAYGTALLVVNTGMPSFVALVVAAIGTLVVAIPVGFAALRVRGASFVIVTIALVLVLQLVFQSWHTVTGGSNGLVVPRPFPDLLRPEHHRAFYFIFLGLLALALVLWALVNHSRFGAGLKAVREDEDKAESLGIPTATLKLVAFTLSALVVALAGGLYGLWFGDLDPIFQFDVVLSAQIVLMALLGGTRFLFGPLLGAVVIGVALEYFVLNYGQTQLHLVATGLLLAIVVLFLPDGVLTGAQQLVGRFRPQATSIRELSAEQLRDEQTATAAGGPPVTATGGPPATSAAEPTARHAAPAAPTDEQEGPR